MTYDLAIIGAGAAGLSAAKAAKTAGLNFILLEAGHRIGGRGLTEEFKPGVPVDLGCHWLHSASINPFVAIADELGFNYVKHLVGCPLFCQGRWATGTENEALDKFIDRCFAKVKRAAGNGRDISVADATPREDPQIAYFDYINSLLTSHDSDQVSVFDHYNYKETNENWPVREGYGALIAKFGADVRVELNCTVQKIDWSGKTIKLKTVRGEIEANKIIVTVSNGILNAGDIQFVPELPIEKQESIAALPIGHYNIIHLGLDQNIFDSDHPSRIDYIGDDTSLFITLRPFGHELVTANVGGRFAEWLEKQPTQTAVDYFVEIMQKIVGNDFKKHVTKTKVSAWGTDPWFKGAYSAAQPGQSHQRIEMGKPVADKLFFAGEATSTDSFATAHGAYLTGIRAVREVVGKT